MRSGLLFTLTTGALTILFLLVSVQFMKDLKPATTAYLFWFFIIWTIIGMMIFPFAVLLIRPWTIGIFWKVLIYLALGLVILNFPFGAQDNRWITIDTIRDLLHPDPDTPRNFTYEIGIFHTLPLAAFSLSLFFFRKKLFHPLPQTRPVNPQP